LHFCNIEPAISESWVQILNLNEKRSQALSCNQAKEEISEEDEMTKYVHDKFSSIKTVSTDLTSCLSTQRTLSTSKSMPCIFGK
jgi:hypothetical protein